VKAKAKRKKPVDGGAKAANESQDDTKTVMTPSTVDFD